MVGYQINQQLFRAWMQVADDDRGFNFSRPCDVELGVEIVILSVIPIQVVRPQVRDGGEVRRPRDAGEVFELCVGHLEDNEVVWKNYIEVAKQGSSDVAAEVDFGMRDRIGVGG